MIEHSTRSMMSRRAALRLTAAGGAAAAVAAAVPGLAAGSPAGPRNVQVSHDGFAHAETFLAANPRDPRNLLGACIAFDEQHGQRFITAYASFDGGASWLNLGVLPDAANGRDPVVTFDAHGRGYICANTDNVHVWRTDDGGRTFAAPVLATDRVRLDHPWLAADPAPGSPSATHLYGVWTGGADNTELQVSRSTDSGRSFEPPRAIDTVRGPGEANFAAPMAAAGSGGAVHAAYGVWPPLEPGKLRPEFPAPIRAISSTDRGLTWGAPVELGIAAMEVRVTSDTNIPSLPTIVAHPWHRFAAAAFVVRPTGAPFTEIAVCLSRDGGRTWTTPRYVPRQDDETAYTQPQLAVDATGRLALSAFAYRRGLVDVVVWSARPWSALFGRPRIVTSAPFDPSQNTLGGKHGKWWIGDYQGLVSTPGRIHPFWNDPRTGRLEIFTATVHGR